MKTHAPQQPKKGAGASTGPRHRGGGTQPRPKLGRARGIHYGGCCCIRGCPVAGTAPTHEDKSGKADGTCERASERAEWAAARRKWCPPQADAHLSLPKCGYPIPASPSFSFGDILI